MPLAELVVGRLAALFFGGYAGYLFTVDRTDALLAIIVSLLFTLSIEVRLRRDA